MSALDHHTATVADAAAYERRHGTGSRHDDAPTERDTVPCRGDDTRSLAQIAADWRAQIAAETPSEEKP